MMDKNGIVSTLTVMAALRSSIQIFFEAISKARLVSLNEILDAMD